MKTRAIELDKALTYVNQLCDRLNELQTRIIECQKYGGGLSRGEKDEINRYVGAIVRLEKERGVRAEVVS